MKLSLYCNKCRANRMHTVYIRAPYGNAIDVAGACDTCKNKGWFVVSQRVAAELKNQ